MVIDYRKLRSVTVRQIIRALLKDGFELVRQKGSHQQYRHPDDNRRVTIAFHKASATFRIGLLKEIIEHQAQWDENDLKRLGLLK